LRADHAPGNISLPDACPARRIRHQLDEVSLLITVIAESSAIGAYCVGYGVFSKGRTLSGGSVPPAPRAPAGGMRGG
jgi:hypothetical protein